MVKNLVILFAFVFVGAFSAPAEGAVLFAFAESDEVAAPIARELDVEGNPVDSQIERACTHSCDGGFGTSASLDSVSTFAWCLALSTSLACWESLTPVGRVEIREGWFIPDAPGRGLLRPPQSVSA